MVEKSTIVLTMKRTCIRCGSEFEGDPGTKYCPEHKPRTMKRNCIRCNAEFEGGSGAKYCKEHRAQRRQEIFEKRIRDTYGITDAHLQKMVMDQDGRCAICKAPLEPGWKRAIDHNHETGKVRGLLCFKCNWGLGHFNDSAEIMRKAVEYLETRG